MTELTFVFIAILLTSCSDSSAPSAERLTAQFLKAFAKTGSSYRAAAIDPLRIEFSSPEGTFRYRYSLAPTWKWFSRGSINSSSQSEITLRQARQAASTLPFVERTHPTFSDPGLISEHFARIHEALHTVDAIEFEGELSYDHLSTDRSGDLKSGSTRYRNRSQFHHGGWTRFDYHPLVQVYDSRPALRVETGKESFLNGLKVEAVEGSGTSTDLDQLEPVREATIRETDSPFTNLNWDNGRTPFLAFVEVLDQQGGSNFFAPENAAQHSDLNILIEPRGEIVRITILAGLLGDGFSKTVLELSPEKNHALVSARREIDVDENAVPAIEWLIEARDFQLAEAEGSRLFYPLHHRFELSAKSGIEVKGEHEIRSMRLLADVQQSDFEIALDESWEIDDRRKKIAANERNGSVGK